MSHEKDLQEMKELTVDRRLCVKPVHVHADTATSNDERKSLVVALEGKLQSLIAVHHGKKKPQTLSREHVGKFVTRAAPTRYAGYFDYSLAWSGGGQSEKENPKVFLVEFYEEAGEFLLFRYRGRDTIPFRLKEGSNSFGEDVWLVYDDVKDAPTSNAKIAKVRGELLNAVFRENISKRALEH